MACYLLDIVLFSWDVLLDQKLSKFPSSFTNISKSLSCDVLARRYLVHTYERVI